MRLALSAIALIAIVSSASAADKPNFSGSWKLNVAKSEYGPIPPPESFTRKVEHAEPSITIVEEQTGPGTTPSTTRKLTTDGQSTVTDINGAPVKLTATWEGSSLLATTSIETFGVTFKDKMSLSADGKEMTSAVQVESPQGSIELKIVFERQ
jgi:hypothetical protein